MRGRSVRGRRGERLIHRREVGIVRRARLEELFGSKGKVQTTSRQFSFRYRSPQHFIEVFRTWYGPMNKTFAALDGDRERQAAFGRDLLELIERGNRSGDETMVVPSEYLEVVIERNR